MNKLTEMFKKLLGSKSLKYGSNSVLLVAVVLAVAVVINLLASPAMLKKVTGKDAIKWDLTPDKLYTLGDTTNKIIKDLNKDIKVYALFDDTKIKDNVELTEANEVLKKYAGPHIKIEYKDLDKNPSFIKSIDPLETKGIKANDFVFVSGTKVRKISKDELFDIGFNEQTYQTYNTGSTAENAFTGAIKYVISEKTPAVYFLEGHGEKKLSTDYKTVTEYLLRNNYETKSLNLTIEGKVPADAEILIFAAPQKDLTAPEKDKIKDFLNNGGKVVFAFDPIDSDPKLTNFDEILNANNVSLNYDIVKENDDTRHIKNKATDILPDIQDNFISNPLDPKNLLMIMPKSRSINILKNSRNDITTTSLMKTSSKAVGELLDKSKGKDNTGPLDLAVAVENRSGAKPSKILVLGNGSFMTDTAIVQYEQYSYNGLYFFLNSLSWMQEKKDDVIIAPKTYSNPKIQMDALQSKLTDLFVLIIYPLIIFGIGTFVWMRRRHL
ncbi:MAG: hypothetical protein K0R31_24 [Clostridiales bacterium]|jgi:ABC-type uncharacterized transport system involved in gliding motility auxiliary subunit|nr:hypothetical protein [Clostridiales bacterium]